MNVEPVIQPIINKETKECSILDEDEDYSIDETPCASPYKNSKGDESDTDFNMSERHDVMPT